MKLFTEAPRLVRTIHTVRTGAFAYCFLALGLLLWERAASPAAWALLAAQFLAYPHLLYLHELRSKQPRQAALNDLFADSTLFGVWCAYFGFEPLIALGLVAGTMLNATVNRGIGGGLLSLGFSRGRRAPFHRRGRLQLRAGRERPRERGAPRRHPRVHLRGRPRGLPPEPAPRSAPATS
jgi:hypothetical protein